MEPTILDPCWNAAAPITLASVVIGRHIRLDAKNRFHAGLARSVVKLCRAKEVAVVRDRHSVHPKRLDLLDERFDAIAAIEQRILRVQVKVNELARHGPAMVRKRIYRAEAHGSIVNGVQQLPTQSDGAGGAGGPRANASIARVLLILVALPVMIVLAVAGFLVIAVFLALAVVLLIMALVRSALRGGAPQPPATRSHEPSARPPIPAHDTEGRENVRVIRRD